MAPDVTDHKPRDIWQNDNLANKFSTSVLYQGKLYGVHGNTIKRKGKCWTAPVLCRGMMYCRNDKGEIVCINMKGPMP